MNFSRIFSSVAYVCSVTVRFAGLRTALHQSSGLKAKNRDSWITRIEWNANIQILPNEIFLRDCLQTFDKSFLSCSPHVISFESFENFQLSEINDLQSWVELVLSIIQLWHAWTIIRKQYENLEKSLCLSFISGEELDLRKHKINAGRKVSWFSEQKVSSVWRNERSVNFLGNRRE